MTGSRANKSLAGRMDWWAVGIFFTLMLLGWINIYAAVYDESAAEGFQFGSRYGSQLMWIGICVVVSAVVMFIDDIYYHILAYPVYIVIILALLATFVIGTEVNGARSWIRLGGFTVQPAEFGKLATALAMARYMSSYHFSFTKPRDLVTIAAIIGLPMAIIVLQNDTGSALVYAAFLLVLFREGLNGWIYVAIGMLIFLFVFSFLVTPAVLLAMVVIICVLMEGIMNRSWKYNVMYLAGVGFFSALLFVGANLLVSKPVDYYWCLLATAVLSLVPVGFYAFRRKLFNVLIPIGFFIGSVAVTNTVDYVFDKLQIHQQKRILNLLGVESDLHKWGYNVNQSKIAIGSGGFWGKGYLQGTQTKYDFVPEQSTDFIFCTVGEEWGFVGSTVVLALFCFLIVRLIIMGERQKEAFGRVYCYCVACIFLLHVVINVGMTIGIMPVIGIPLPLFSYGGSSLLAFTILFFIAVKLDSRKREGELLGRS